jgi:hypothetical protein
MLIGTGTDNGNFLGHLHYFQDRPGDANFDPWAIGRG